MRVAAGPRAPGLPRAGHLAQHRAQLRHLGLAPAGSGKVREMLRQAQLGLVVGGEQGTFTPMYLVLARKPL